MSETIDIKTIHPELEHVSSAPTQFGFFGIGTRLYGARDYNAQSGSHVSTLYFTVLFIPVIPISSYRIARRGASSYVLGKVPLSPLAKKTRLAVASTLLVGGAGFGTYSYLTSPGYIAGRQLSEADGLVASGSNAKAAGLYKTVFENAPEEYRDRASEAMQHLLESKSIATMPARELAGTITTIRSIPRWKLSLDNEHLFADGKARLAALQKDSPVEAHQLYHSIADLAAGDAAFVALDEPLLRASLKKEPGDVGAVDELAQMLFARGQVAQAVAMLKTVESRLGSREGARILGQAYVAQGDHEHAYPLLTAYMGDRLKALNEAEKHYFDLQKNLMQAEFDKLNNGQGDPAFYDKYKATPEDKRQALVDEYIANGLRGNKDLEAALANYGEKAKVVPVALDYGIVLLRRAESMPDATARKAELNRAETTFLSIRSVAGDSDDFHLYLGQVYYWLGKQAEGHKEFDDLLGKYQRSPESLLSVAGILRSIGMDAETIAMAKEAYEKAGNKEQKYGAALLLSQTVLTPQDKVHWLQLSDPGSTYVMMDLATEKGYAAERDGDGAKAAGLFRQAIERSAALPENATTYNNVALIHLALYRVSGDQAALANGIALMEKAIELTPTDSILLANVASILTTSALRGMYAGKIDFGLLQTDPSLEYLDFLYEDEHGYDEYRAKIAADPMMQRATDYLKKSVLLAPKAARNYFSIYELATFTRDKALLAYMDEKLAKSNVDLESTKKLASDYVRNIDQGEVENALRKQIVLYRAVADNERTPAQTRAVAKSKLAELLLRQVQEGSLASADEAVRLLEEAHKLHPSRGTTRLLEDALLTQASLAVAKQSPTYMKARRDAGRNLADDVLVAVTLYRNGPDAALLQQQPAAQRAFAMIEQDTKLFPSSTRTMDWATIAHQKPAAASVLSQAIRASAQSKLGDAIERKLYSFSSHAAVESFLYNEVGGKPLDSAAVLAEYKRAHAFLPGDLL